MNDIVTVAVVSLFMFASCWQQVSSLRCYICQSTQNPDCGDKFRVLPADASNCPPGSRCVKFRGFRGSGVVKSPEVDRYCDSDYETNGCREEYRNGIDGEACVCNRDLCNSASLSEYSLSVMSGSILLFLVCSFRGWV